MAEEMMSKRMLGLTDDDGKKSAADKKSGKSSYLSNKQWVALGIMMGGAGVLLGGVMSYFNRGHI